MGAINMDCALIEQLKSLIDLTYQQEYKQRIMALTKGLMATTHARVAVMGYEPFDCAMGLSLPAYSAHWRRGSVLGS